MTTELQKEIDRLREDVRMLEIAASLLRHVHLHYEQDWGWYPYNSIQQVLTGIYGEQPEDRDERGN